MLRPLPTCAAAILTTAISVFCQDRATSSAEAPSAPLRVLFSGSGEFQSAPHGEGNVYAPDVHADRGRLRMWFGAQGEDGHDRICLAESTDGRQWEQRGVVLEDRTANHINDPSLVKVDGVWWMFYTRAARDVVDEIAAATSDDGVHWTPRGTVLTPSPDPHAWDSLLVGRPSVLHENGIFRMWYDGRRDLPPGSPAQGVPKSPGSRRHVGYAESVDGLRWERFAGNPVHGNDAGAVSVLRLRDDAYLMLHESRRGTAAAISADGLRWRPRGLWFGVSGTEDDAWGHVTPHLTLAGSAEESGTSGSAFPTTLHVGAAPAATWDRNRMAAIPVAETDLARILTRSPLPAFEYPDHRDLGVVLEVSTGTLRPIRIAADWAIRRRHVVDGFLAVTGPDPFADNAVTPAPTGPRAAPSFERLSSETREGHSVTTIRFAVDPPAGDILHALLYEPNSGSGEVANGGRAGILALHPTHAIGKHVVDGGSELPNRAYARELADRGFVVVAPDYPSFGDAAGYDFHSDGLVSGTMKGIVNHRRCVDLLVSLPDVDPGRIGVIGHSLGGHNAIFAALLDERIRAVVTSCGWTPFHHYYGGNLQGWTSDRYLPAIRTRFGNDPDRVPFDFAELIAALAPRAFFSNSPIRDDNFAVAGVQEAEASIRAIYRLHNADSEDRLRFRYPDAGHDFPPDEREAAYRFLEEALRNP